MTFIPGIKFLELLITSSRTRISKIIRQKRLATLRLEPEWLSSRLAISTKWPQILKMVMIQARGKKVLSKVTREMSEMPSFKWKSSRSNKKLKKSKEPS